MLGFAHSFTSSSILQLNSFPRLPVNSSSRAFMCRIGYGHNMELFVSTAKSFLNSHSGDYRCHKKKPGKFTGTKVKSSRREPPYEVLGLSLSASTDEIKRAYRRLALKYHPDVNKEVGSQEKFMRIKQAYNTLLNSKSRSKYDRTASADFSYSASGEYEKTGESEEFYGLEDFFRDLQEEFQNREATAASQGKPKSLWEELAEIGEDFVEFLEKELNITDPDRVENSDGSSSKVTGSSGEDNDTSKSISIDDNINEIEAALAQLKKELGL